MIYIMVTNWENHRGNLRDNSTYFTVGMLRGNMNENKLKDDTRTIFIKRNKETRSIENTWIGKVAKISEGTRSDGKKRIYFRVIIKDTIPCPGKYSNYSEGWYIAEEEMEENERIIREFIKAWSRLDPEELAAYFADDGVYHNMPISPVSGRGNVEKFIQGFVGSWTETTWDILNIMSSGNVVIA